MLNEEIAKTFENMARLLAFKNEDRFRIMAYERAAVSLRDLDVDLATIAREGKLDEIPGIGKDLAGMIEEYIRTRKIKKYEQARRGIPDGLIVLMSIPGLGPKTLALFHKKLKVNDLESLKRALESGKAGKLPGFGPKKAENLQRGIDLWTAGHKRMLLGVALPMGENLLEQLRKIKLVTQADMAGSLRRKRETIGDMDMVIGSPDGARALQECVKLPVVKQVLAIGGTRATVIIEGGIQVDLRAVSEDCYGAALQYFTGSKQHNVHLRSIAHERGLKVNEYGVFRGEKNLGGRAEKDVYALLDMPVMPPEIREDRGEIEAAMEGRLPRLIGLADLRGDLHAHTDYSDGKATVEEMARHAAELGYEYIALTDHSPSQRIANGLDVKRLEEKIREVERVRKKLGVKPRILLGTEVDILADGKLDYPDEVLAKLDVVVASIHSLFRGSREELTKRMIAAIENRHVHILGHPTGRLIGTREPLEFDFDAVLRSAIRHGVALEVNGSMYRLDLNDVMAKAAQEAGALLAIGSDAHSTAQLDQIRYGVFQAQRGWVEARSVVNTWAWPKLERWLQSRGSVRAHATRRRSA
ncbi:MAG TPA: DNA polymerase/3'-5' exonuclease PolX [Bryobacteraceae bacterium]|nr:DNA polymerase/3'-5' exonuclease PolX [Bryobacteraceae bacterium]